MPIIAGAIIRLSPAIIWNIGSAAPSPGGGSFWLSDVARSVNSGR